MLLTSRLHLPFCLSQALLPQQEILPAPYPLHLHVTCLLGERAKIDFSKHHSCGLFCEVTGTMLYPEQGGLNKQPLYLQPAVLGVAYSWFIPQICLSHIGAHGQVPREVHGTLCGHY